MRVRDTEGSAAGSWDRGLTKAIFGLLIACGAGAARVTAQAEPVDAVTESVRRAFEDYQRRLNSGDLAGALEYYADDPRFFWVTHDKIVARSKAEIVKGYEQLKGSGATITYATPRITVLSTDAAVITTTLSARMGKGPKAAQFSSLLTLVLIRTEAGWRFLTGRA